MSKVKVKSYFFEFVSNEKYHAEIVHSKHLQGVVRKLFQIHKVDNLVKIVEVRG